MISRNDTEGVRTSDLPKAEKLTTRLSAPGSFVRSRAIKRMKLTKFGYQNKLFKSMSKLIAEPIEH